MTKEAAGEASEAPTGDIAVVGEGAEQGHVVSMKALQAIYHDITGKSEELTKRYDQPIRATFADIEQLHHKMQQVCEQYAVEANNVSVTVFHLDDTKEEFSSFERFRLYNQSVTSPVESIVLKYNYMIVLPKTKKAQSYTVSVRVASGVTTLAKMNREISGIPSELVILMSGNSVVATVTYVDYMVARMFLTVVEGWFSGLKKVRVHPWFQYFRRHSEICRSIGAYSMGALVLFLVWDHVPVRLSALATPPQVVQFLLVALGLLFVGYRLGNFLGRTVEKQIDQWSEVGYLKINRGDEVQIEEAEQRNKRSIIKAIGATIFTIATGVAATVVEKWLTGH